MKDRGTGAIGIDLGLSMLATTSDGEKIENPRQLARHGEALPLLSVRAEGPRQGHPRQDQEHPQALAA